MSTINLNGINLNLEIYGDGPPLIALHGFTGSSSTWHPLAQAIQSTNTIFAVDLIGHGASSKPRNSARYSMERTVEDLLTMLNILGLPRANWLGYSMGGRIALSLGLQAPDKCTSLILESTSPGIKDASSRRARVNTDEDLAMLLESQGIAAFESLWASLPLWASQARLSNETKQSLKSQRLSNDPQALAASLRGIGSGRQPYVGDKVSSLAVPTCFIAGEEDEQYRRLALSMAREVKKGKAVIVANAGHALHLEQPETFQKTISAFLNDKKMQKELPND